MKLQLNDRHYRPYRKEQSGYTIAYLILVAIWLAAIGGWIANIVKLAGMNFDGPITTWIVLRIAGIFVAPMGSVLGYL